MCPLTWAASRSRSATDGPVDASLLAQNDDIGVVLDVDAAVPTAGRPAEGRARSVSWAVGDQRVQWVAHCDQSRLRSM